MVQPSNYVENNDAIISKDKLIYINEDDGVNIADLYSTILYDLSDTTSIVPVLNEDYLPIPEPDVVPQLENVDRTNITPANIIPNHRVRYPNSRLIDNIVAAVNTHSVDYPTYSQTMKSPQKTEWEEAVKTELSTISKMDTYDVVLFKDIPKGSEILTSKFHLKVKYTSLKKFLKFKARLVVLGNKSKHYIIDLFAPTASYKSISLIIALAVSLGLIIVGYDIYGAFLIPSISRNVYISLPKCISSTPIY